MAQIPEWDARGAVGDETGSKLNVCFDCFKKDSTKLSIDRADSNVNGLGRFAPNVYRGHTGVQAEREEEDASYSEPYSLNNSTSIIS